MNRLVIHPEDRSTEFLTPIYGDLDDVTLVRGGYTKEYIRSMIKDHDQVMMMGHGSPFGLMSVGKFPGRYNVIDDSFVDLLSEKDNSIFIWCNADQFTEKHKLNGFYSGMFISELSEAWMCGVDAIKKEVEESNASFSKIMGHALKSGPDMPIIVKNEYGKLAYNNPVAEYNHKRLYVH